MSIDWWGWVDRGREEAGTNPYWQLRVAVVSSPIALHNKSSEMILRKFLALLGSTFEHISLFSGNLRALAQDAPQWVELHDRCHDTLNSRLVQKAARFGRMQAQLASEISRWLRGGGDLVFFFNAGLLCVPLTVVRVSRAKTVLFNLGSATVGARMKYSGLGRFAVIPPLELAQHWSCLLADRIAVDSPSVAAFPPINRHHSKTLTISTFVDTTLFRCRREMPQRTIDVGFIGRFSSEKGLIQLLNGITAVREIRPRVRVLLAGSGPLEEELRALVSQSRLDQHVKIRSWLPYEQVPNVLNDLKVLILPSDVEGLPNIVIEAMACGTPVLATKVGGIPDVVEHGRTGWLLCDNRSETIARGITAASASENLECMSRQAVKTINARYSPEAAVARLRTALQSTLGF